MPKEFSHLKKVPKTKMTKGVQAGKKKQRPIQQRIHLTSIETQPVADLQLNRCYLLRCSSGEAIICGDYFGPRDSFHGARVDPNDSCFVVKNVYKPDYPAPDNVPFEFMSESINQFVLWSRLLVQLCPKEHHSINSDEINSDVIDLSTDLNPPSHHSMYRYCGKSGY